MLKKNTYNQQVPMLYFSIHHGQDTPNKDN
jgi:hypothetical protein